MNKITVLSYSFSILELVLLGVLLLMFIYQLYFYVHYINGVLRLNTKIKKGKVTFSVQTPPVTVIICARDEERNLRQFLPFVLDQDYPEFEVIVIDDASEDNTKDLLDELKKTYSNLRTTFVPKGTANLSTKKLAITLGVKAAKYDWLLLTDGDCMPEDKTWLAKMARNFVPATEFVLGYGAYLEKDTFLNRLITYDTLFIALQYMGMAIAGKPYMGVGRNLAYRKEVFYRQKGFSAYLHLPSGDDDLMVNKAANAKNTRVEVAPESVTWSEPEISFEDWRRQKERHLSVSPYYSSVSRRRLVLEPITRACFYIAFILMFVFGNWVSCIAGGVFFIARFLTQMLVINKSNKHFGAKRKYFLTLLLFDIYLPVQNLFLLIFGRMGRKSNRIKWK